MDRGISTSTLVSSQFILKSVADVLGEFGGKLAHFGLDMHDLELAHFVMDQIAKTIQKVPDTPKCSGTLRDAPNIM